MVASRDEKKPPNKLVVYPLTVPSGRGVQLSPVSTKNTVIPPLGLLGLAAFHLSPQDGSLDSHRARLLLLGRIRSLLSFQNSTGMRMWRRMF